MTEKKIVPELPTEWKLDQVSEVLDVCYFLVCDKMTLNQTLGRIFKMLEAMSRLPCEPIASSGCLPLL